MINHLSKSNKLTQKEYKTRHDWVGKAIHWESCKKPKFYQMNKWYMHSPESVQENEMHNLLWDFEIQMEHLISARSSDSHQRKKKEKRGRERERVRERERTCWIVDFAIPGDHRVKLKESKKKKMSYRTLA